MSETHRSRTRSSVTWLTLGGTVLLLAACGAATGSSSGVPSTVVATPGASVAAVATSTARPTPAPRPTRIARPSDMPTDGACDEGHTCLGLLAPKVYHADLFEPSFAFTIADGRWVNLATTPGNLGVESIDVPGDGVYFFAHPRAVKPDGSLDLSVKMTAAGVADWLAGNPNLTVGPVSNVDVGGLSGKTMAIALGPDAVTPTGDCPVQRCLPLFNAQGSTWEWDWGIADSELQRVYALDGKDGVVLVLAESLDGTTIDSITQSAQSILKTVKFDQ